MKLNWRDLSKTKRFERVILAVKEPDVLMLRGPNTSSSEARKRKENGYDKYNSSPIKDHTVQAIIVEGLEDPLATSAVSVSKTPFMWNLVPEACANLVASLSIDFVKNLSADAAELPLVGQSVAQFESGSASSSSFTVASRFVDRSILCIGVQDFFKLAYFHTRVQICKAATVELI